MEGLDDVEGLRDGRLHSKHQAGALALDDLLARAEDDAHSAAAEEVELGQVEDDDLRRRRENLHQLLFELRRGSRVERAVERDLGHLLAFFPGAKGNGVGESHGHSFGGLRFRWRTNVRRFSSPSRWYSMESVAFLMRKMPSSPAARSSRGTSSRGGFASRGSKWMPRSRTSMVTAKASMTTRSPTGPSAPA